MSAQSENQSTQAVTFQQSRICDLLQWLPETLAVFIYERGIEYLETYFNHDEQAIKKMSARAEFWNWWKAQWSIRDEAYLYDIDGREDAISVVTRNKIYRSLHLTRLLVCEIAPPRLVYPSDFAVVKMQMS